MKKWIWLLVLSPVCAHGQFLPTPHYPQHYFQNPLEIPITLAGNFGELRPDHFHAGIDIKTQGRTGLAVHAAAAGYISRVSVSAGGYGNLVCITHPNGYTTLYGHLQRFMPALAGYVKAHEYAQKNWTIDLDIPAGRFPVTQGELIAWSGSTGDAVAPHLHFEIRDTRTGAALNAMLFGLDIRDDIPPAVYRIAVFDRDLSIYEQVPAVYALKKPGEDYVPDPTLIQTDFARVGFGVNTIDRQNGTNNTFGIYEAILVEDGSPRIGFQLDDIGYWETRYVNAHVDYKTRASGGAAYELLFPLPGNRLGIYYPRNGNGDIDLSDEQLHHVLIQVKDASGNTSTVRFDIRYSPQARDHRADTACNHPMNPGKENMFHTGQLEFSLDSGMLYDQICFSYAKIQNEDPGLYSDIFRLYTDEVPLNGDFTLRVKPDRTIPSSLRDKLVIFRQGSRTHEEVAAEWDGDWLTAKFRNFGEFSVRTDESPPTIRPLRLREDANLSRADKIAFRIGDQGSGLKSYSAELDGQWLMFARKGNMIWYEFDSHCSRGHHLLKLTATDETGNQSSYILHFQR